MRRLFDLGFFMAIALACVGLDFYILKRDHGDQAFGMAQYLTLRKDDVKDIINPPGLAAAMPSGLQGWETRTQGADHMLKGGDHNREDQVNEIALVKAIAALEKASHPAGEMLGMTMAKGDTRLRLMAVLEKPQEKIAGIEIVATDPASLDPALSVLMQQRPVQQGDAPYSVVDGVAFTELPAAAVTGDASLRMMRATLGEDLSVTVVTKSTDDAAIREAMQAIDFVMLNKLLQKPVLGVADGRTTDLRLDPAYAAYIAQTQPAPAQQDAAAFGTKMGTAPDANPLPGAVSLTPAVKPNAVPAETAVFIAPPNEKAGSTGQPCVRRSGVLLCPDG